MTRPKTLALSFVVFAAALSLAAAWGLAQEEPMNFTVQGKVTKREGDKLTMNSEGNIIFHVVLNEKTEVKKQDGGEASAKELQVGTRIHVDGDLQESGEIIAKKVSILSESGSGQK